MRFGPEQRLRARVEWHLNEGFTRLLLEDTVGVGLADGGIAWEVPTACIPPALRSIGTRLTLRWRPLRDEPGDSLEELRAAQAQTLAIEPRGDGPGA